MKNLLLVVPIITGLAGSYLTYYFTIKSKQQESILKFKEEKYSNLLILLQGFVGNTVSGDTKKRFFEEQYKSWLYSSDEVVVAVNNMVSLVIESHGKTPDPDEGRKAIGEIVLAMRKDLMGKSKLTFIDFRYTNVYK